MRADMNELSSASSLSPQITAGRRAQACAECRRLKLKCDRLVPCSTCVKRGCTHICPDGQLERGPQHESRAMLADNRKLRDRADALRKRLESLQAAIRTMRGEGVIPTPDTSPSSHEEVEGSEEDSELTAVVSTLGTLHLGDRPDFIGGYGASDMLLENNMPKMEFSSRSRREAGKGVVGIDTLLCIWLNPKTEPLDALVNLLPSRGNAYNLIDQYLSHFAWMIGGLIGVDVYHDILDVVYPSPASDSGPAVNMLSAPDLALLFTMLSVAVLVDLGSKPDGAQAWWYAGCSRVALAVSDVFERPSISGIRAMHILLWNWHILASDYPPARKNAYVLQGLAVQLAKSIGMHRDDSHWDMDDAERQNRRGLLWDMSLMGGFISASHNRPPVLPREQLDALLPTDPYSIVDANGRTEESYASFTHRYSKNVLLPVISRAFGVRPVTYSIILQLDRLIRDYPVPHQLRIHQVGERPEGMSTEQLFQSLNIFVFTRKLLVYIHRPFFARAVHSRGADPLASPFRESFISAFRAACDVTASMRVLFHHVPVGRRITYLWSACFTCSVVQCAIMIRAPSCVLVHGAWHEFSLTLQMLEELSKVTENISHMIPSLQKLRDKAIASMADAAHMGPEHAPWETELDVNEEAFIFGRAHVVATTPDPKPNMNGKNNNSNGGNSGRCGGGGSGGDSSTDTGNNNNNGNSNGNDNGNGTNGSSGSKGGSLDNSPMRELMPGSGSTQSRLFNTPPQYDGTQLQPFQLDYMSGDSLHAWNDMLKASELLGTHSVMELDDVWNDLLMDLNDHSIPVM
ncbi:hypothetical protein BKA62DRAFT_709030 [Auriculariales sp. MPI-PUGE-AT-0066]|nr:hypothetical protein BKA62DRAFT_709030 [Auriculariales sp. MPI-PUGE-AT-0066]